MPPESTVRGWVLDDVEGFAAQYARARDMQADKMVDDILEIADDGRNDTYLDADGNERTDQEVIARSKLRVEARKWIASKFAPKKYGDKQAVELTGANGGPVEVSDADKAARLAGILALAQARKAKEGPADAGE